MGASRVPAPQPRHRALLRPPAIRKSAWLLSLMLWAPPGINIGYLDFESRNQSRILEIYRRQPHRRIWRTADYNELAAWHQQHRFELTVVDGLQFLLAQWGLSENSNDDLGAAWLRLLPYARNGLLAVGHHTKLFQPDDPAAPTDPEAADTQTRQPTSSSNAPATPPTAAGQPASASTSTRKASANTTTASGPSSPPGWANTESPTNGTAPKPTTSERSKSEPPAKPPAGPEKAETPPPKSSPESKQTSPTANGAPPAGSKT